MPSPGRSERASGHPDRIVPKTLTVEEAAWSLGISITKIYRLVSEGRLRVSKIDGNSVFDPADLVELRDRHKILKNQ